MLSIRRIVASAAIAHFHGNLSWRNVHAPQSHSGRFQATIHHIRKGQGVYQAELDGTYSVRAAIGAGSYSPIEKTDAGGILLSA